MPDGGERKRKRFCLQRVVKGRGGGPPMTTREKKKKLERFRNPLHGPSGGGEKKWYDWSAQKKGEECLFGNETA